MTTGSTLIVVHRHGVVSAIRLLAQRLGFAAKSGIISIKCGLCSRKTAQAISGCCVGADECNEAAILPQTLESQAQDQDPKIAAFGSSYAAP
ncbi:hypothetical protein AK973_4904 [Pseudomonas brassicacearum]|nr:hypothetical protein AK973_4904 [Pseudomonas brassicacearum]